MIRFGRHKRIDEACFVGDLGMVKEDTVTWL